MRQLCPTECGKASAWCPHPGVGTGSDLGLGLPDPGAGTTQVWEARAAPARRSPGSSSVVPTAPLLPDAVWAGQEAQPWRVPGQGGSLGLRGGDR